MSPDKQKSIKAMRTFARDLERERGDGTETSTKEPESPKIETPHKKEPVIKSFTVKKPKPKKDEKNDKKISPEPKHIPAFHELQKAIRTDIKADSEKIKKGFGVKNKKAITPSKPVGGGTIITDTKKNRRPFFAELSTSIQNWFKEIQKQLKPKKKNTYVVPKTERRKGVVQKATSKTGTIFSADNETLREQIKARQRAEKHSEDDSLSWSPYTETGYPLIEGEETESIDPRVNKVSVTSKTHTVPKPVVLEPVIKSTEKIPELIEKVEEPIPDIPAPVEDAPTPEPEETIDDSTFAVEPEATVESEPNEESDLDVSEEENTWGLENVSVRDTNTMALLLVGVVLALGIIGLVIYSIFDFGNNQDSQEVIETFEAVYPNAQLGEMTLSNRSFNELVSKINSELIENSAGVNNEYRFVFEESRRVPAGTMMTILKTGTADNFADTVTDVRLVETMNNHRALILSIPDPVTARGGMLNWESTLLADVGVLMDVRNVPPSAGEFTDTQFGEMDVRTLTFNNKTLIVYALVDDKKIIIANNIEVLTPYLQ